MKISLRFGVINQVLLCLGTRGNKGLSGKATAKIATQIDRPKAFMSLLLLDLSLKVFFSI
jgi:hypothetical protein